MNAAKPSSLLPPFLLDEKVYDTLAEVPILREDVVSPSSTWTFARKTSGGEKMPQTIAHRGYNAEHPENTMGAFAGAVKIGAHAAETDLHMSKDDVVVLSHDATLKRCYGKEEKIRDCDWDYLSQQRTLRAPHEPMPRLQDLLQYLARPGSEQIWLLLDIKMTNDAETIIRLIAHTISLVAPSPSKPWPQRLVLGIWAAKFLPHCARYLPNYPISHIGFSIPYARQFLKLPNISFNTLQKALMGPGGSSFVRDVKARDRPLYVWTVNEDYFMRWSIDHQVDGVITDDPKKFLEVCDRWEKGDRKVEGWGWAWQVAQMDFDDVEKFLKGEDSPGVCKLSPDVRYPTGGQTALHMAALNNDVKGVQLLLRYGADKGIEDEDGQAALDMAKNVGAKEVYTLLL